MAFPLPLDGAELAIYPQDDITAGSIPNGQTATPLLDYSGKNRTLTATGSAPVYQTNIINGKGAVYWNGTKNPLKNSAVFTVRCGFLIIRIDEDVFSNYAGILTDTSVLPILVGEDGTTHFYDETTTFKNQLFELRGNDRIYSRVPETDEFSPPAPMEIWRIYFFRFWNSVTVNGIQFGQDRADTSRKGKFALALAGIYSTDFCESEIRMREETLAAHFNLALADVFPFQADADSSLADTQAANIDFPSSGGQIAETLGGVKIEGELKFTNRSQAEVKRARAYLRQHYAQSPFIYRSYALIPPEDHEGYATSLIEHAGAATYHNKSYSFSFKEN